MLALAFQLLATGDDDVGELSAGGFRPRVRVSASLVARLRGREQDAYNELLRTTFEPLVLVAMGIVESADLAEDVVQDVMVWLWNQGESWNPGASPAAYLIGAVRHRALNVVRTHVVEARYRERVTHDEHHRGSGIARTDWDAEVRDLQSTLARVLSTLTERQRTAFLLRTEQHLTIPEVATTLGIGVRAAEKLVSRAMRTVRDALRAAIEA